MRAGRLRNMVTVEQPVKGSAGSYGGTAITWTEYAKVWADIIPASGARLFAAQAAQSKVDAEIRMRFLDGITAGMRINHGGTYYNIEYVLNPNMRDRELVLMCSTGVDEG